MTADPFRAPTTCFSAASLRWPERLVASGWLEHIPFAFWLIDRMRPKVLVELGAYTGASYFAFCQAVKESAVDCRCHAVDTWQGDPHAGSYGEKVFEDFRAYHDARYADFSSPHRSTFDDAVDAFADGSIDLLHIDGFHTYDAVAHDFETWRPKLSKDGVVLFHDTAVEREDFGVYRLWRELSATQLAFEFGHGNGLGVLAAGPDVNGRLRDLFAAARSADETHVIRALYAALGQRLMQYLQLSQLEARNRKLQDDVQVYRARLQTRNEQLKHYVEFSRKLQAERAAAPREGLLSSITESAGAQKTSLSNTAVSAPHPPASAASGQHPATEREKSAGKQRIIVLYHTYKAGGSTVIHGLKTQYGASGLLEVDKHPNYASEKAYNIAFFERIVSQHPDVVAYTAHRVVPNIHFSKTLDVYPITFVRHPLLRAMSVYRFERIRRDEWPRKEFALKYDFPDWILWCLDSDQVVESRNYQTCLLSLNDAGQVTTHAPEGARRGDLSLVYQRLDAMPTVGVVEMFPESLAAINKAGQALFPGLALPDALVNSTKVVKDWQAELRELKAAMPADVRSRFDAANEDDLALFERYRFRLASTR